MCKYETHTCGTPIRRSRVFQVLHVCVLYIHIFNKFDAAARTTIINSDLRFCMFIQRNVLNIYIRRTNARKKDDVRLF